VIELLTELAELTGQARLDVLHAGDSAKCQRRLSGTRQFTPRTLVRRPNIANKMKTSSIAEEASVR